MKTISLEELLEAGCHFGHQVTRQNPKARDYVFEERDNIHIIDLEKTKEGLEEAGVYVKNIATRPSATMIILGAKRQAQDVVKSEVQRAKSEGLEGLYSVTNRWIGGTMTNLGEVSKNFKRLSDINKLFANDFEKQRFTKKELLLLEREKQKLMTFYDGITEMTRTPDVIFIIDTHLEYLAVREAKAMNVKVVGITDTNADPTIIDYAIPANDDAVGSIKLITSYIVDAWIEGKKAAAKSEAQNASDAAKAVEQSAESKGTASTSNVAQANVAQANLPAGKAGAADAKGAEPARNASHSDAGGGTKGANVKDGAVQVAKPAYKQSAAGREKDKAKSTARSTESKGKVVGLAKEKKKETKDTPEKISTE